MIDLAIAGLIGAVSGVGLLPKIKETVVQYITKPVYITRRIVTSPPLLSHDGGEKGYGIYNTSWNNWSNSWNNAMDENAGTCCNCKGSNYFGYNRIEIL